jgi:lysophospholipase
MSEGRGDMTAGRAVILAGTATGGVPGKVDRRGAPGNINRRALPEGAVETHWIAADGHAIRRIDLGLPAARAPRGTLLFVPGRGDCYEKYVESLSDWQAGGWQVTALDWRGQAGSGRLGLDTRTGHIDDLALWVADLAAFWAEWVQHTKDPQVLVAHSMGGHLALRCVAEHRTVPAPAALVLSVPMLGMSVMGLPAWLLHPLVRVIARLGDPRRAAWAESEKPGSPPDERMLLLTHDAGRYADEAWWREASPELAMGSPSWRWVERSLASIRGLDRPGVLEGVAVPVLLIAARADRLVSVAAIARAARRLPRGELFTFGPEAAHEVLREVDPVRDVAMAKIDEFLDRVAPERQPAA